MPKVFLILAAILLAVMMPLALGADFGELVPPVLLLGVIALTVFLLGMVLARGGGTTRRSARNGMFTEAHEAKPLHVLLAIVHSGMAILGPGVRPSPA